MSLIITTDEKVSIKREVVIEAQGVNKNIVFMLFDFKNDVGYIVINTEDINGGIIKQIFCRISGGVYNSLLTTNVIGKDLKEVIEKEISGFAKNMDIKMKGIKILELSEFIQSIANLTRG